MEIQFRGGKGARLKKEGSRRRVGTHWLGLRVSWLNRGTNKRSHYTRCINKSRQPIIRFDLRLQPARLLLQADRALKPYLRAAEYIIPKISVRTIQEKASATPMGVREHIRVPFHVL